MFARSLAIIISLFVTLHTQPHLRAEELDTIFGRVNDLVSKKNYAKALEELTLARNEIEKMHHTRISSFFPDQLGDYTAGKLETNSALGFSNIERTYSKDSHTIKVSLTGDSGSGTQALGGIAAIGRMAAMFGQHSGQDTIRIGGRSAIVNAPQGSGSADLTIFLDAGSILRIEQSKSADTATLRAFAEKLDIHGLETYLKGNA